MKKETYKITRRCSNCGKEVKLEIPKGISIEKYFNLRISSMYCVVPALYFEPKECPCCGVKAVKPI